MEDEQRELPSGWVRQYDAENHHQFFVDTTAEPPRSIWQHPYDDDVYLHSLAPAERTRIQGLHRSPTDADIAHEETDDEDAHPHAQAQTHAPAGAAGAKLPPRPDAQPKGLHKLGRSMKDKLTSSTHEERELQRRKRDEEEQRAYKQHQAIRAAMSRAIETGEPQLLGKDRNGKDVYVESPFGRGVPQGAYGYNPFGQGAYGNGRGAYGSPNARYLRPQQPYSRPYGMGYGGGFGYPMGAAMLGGGLLGGGLLGAGMMF